MSGTKFRTNPVRRAEGKIRDDVILFKAVAGLAAVAVVAAAVESLFEPSRNKITSPQTEREKERDKRSCAHYTPLCSELQINPPPNTLLHGP